MSTCKYFHDKATWLREEVAIAKTMLTDVKSPTVVTKSGNVICTSQLASCIERIDRELERLQVIAEDGYNQWLLLCDAREQRDDR